MTETEAPTEAVATERGHLRARLELAATRRPDFLRMEMVCAALRLNLAATGGRFLLLPHDDCLSVAYGNDGASKFWKARLSKSMTVTGFLRIMALLNADSGSAEQVNGLALRSALHDAYDMGVPWLVRGASFDDPNLRVIPRPAASWLLENEMFSHLVPHSLATFLLAAVEGNGEALANQPRRPSMVEVRTEFKSWAASLATWPSKRQADDWAKHPARKYSTTLVRKLQREGSPRGPGRPAKLVQ